MKTSATPSESTFASATAATVRMKAASAETGLKAVDAPKVATVVAGLKAADAPKVAVTVAAGLKAVDAPKVVVTVVAGPKAVSVADAPSPKMMRAK